MNDTGGSIYMEIEYTEDGEIVRLRGVLSKLNQEFTVNGIGKDKRWVGTITNKGTRMDARLTRGGPGVDITGDKK